MEPGQSRNVKSSPRYWVERTLSSTLICRARASAVKSPRLVPPLTEPLRVTAPVTAAMLSRSNVLPLPYGPIRAMHRVPDLLLGLDMRASLAKKGPGMTRLAGPSAHCCHGRRLRGLPASGNAHAFGYCPSRE